MAACDDHKEVVQILLEKSANIDFQNNVCSNNLVFFKDKGWSLI